MADQPRRFGRPWHWVVGIVVAVVLVIVALSYLISSDMLARYIENRMNSRLKGYTVHIGRAYFHPVTFSLDLRDMSLQQNANSDPPVARIARMAMSVHWGELLRAHLVGDLDINQPRLYINLKNLQQEEKSKVPLQQKGWQDAVQSIYPLKINLLTVSDGELTYVDRGPFKPLHVSKVNLSATNIRNIHYPNSAYPSPISLNARLFDKGTLTLTGNANFLAEPHFGVKADVDLKDLEAGYFAPITARSNILLRKGTISANGGLEYGPKVTAVDLKRLAIKGIDLDYVHLAKTAEIEKERARKARQTAKELSTQQPEASITAGLLTIADSRFAYVNKTSTPNYTLFINGVDLSIKDFSNQPGGGPSTVKMTGKFMGTGDTKITGTFRPGTKSPDFVLNVAIDNTQMPAMNDLFRAYGKFDIKSGLFSFYSELTVRNNTINGYVKPLFKDLEVTDMRNNKEKGIFHKLYVGLVKGLTELLKNPETKAVATQTPISGKLEGQTKTDLWQTVINLVRNAFVRAILPGFERQISQKK